MNTSAAFRSPLGGLIAKTGPRLTFFYHRRFRCPIVLLTQGFGGGNGSDNALRSGDATWARIIGSNGRGVADMDVGTKKEGNAWFAFNTVSFMKGGPVTVYARMAIFDERRRAEDEED